MLAPWIVAAGLTTGLPALAAWDVRRRIGLAAGGITGADLAVHAALLANTLLLAAVVALRATAPSDVLLGPGLTTGALALLGVPVSVSLSWCRAWTPRSGPRDRPRAIVVGVAHLANVGAAAVVLASWSPSGAALLGSIA